MANINDSAGIFTGSTLDAFNELERLVGRDGDVAGTKAELEATMRRISASVVTPAGSGATYTRRKQ